jgi:hypothetical protein
MLYRIGLLRLLTACEYSRLGLNTRYSIAYKITRFLLARLYIELLCDKRRKREVLSTLNQLSRGLLALDDAYNKAIKQIDEQLPGDRLLARRAISWIVYAKRPLTTRELCHALSIEPGDKALDSDDIYGIETVISVCAGLAVVDEESNIVRLVHYTTQEYFERELLDWHPSALEDMAVACLTYLSFDTFRSGSCAYGEAFKRRLAENAFFDYSARYWSEHTRPVESTTSRFALAFLCDGALVDRAVQAALIFPCRTSGLHLTTRYGLVYLTERLLTDKYGDSNIGADWKDNSDQTPLTWAVKGGHEAVVRLLVDRDDVKADSKDGNGRTPLWWAVWESHEAVVRLLVERDDVEADSKDIYGRTPLSWAASQAHEAVVRLLVERDDVEADSKDEEDRTPLS